MRCTPLPRPSGVGDALLSSSSYPRTTLRANGEHLQAAQRCCRQKIGGPKNESSVPFSRIRWTHKAHHVCPEKCNQISFCAFSRPGLHKDCLHPHRGESILKAALCVCYCRSRNSDHRAASREQPFKDTKLSPHYKGMNRWWWGWRWCRTSSHKRTINEWVGLIQQTQGQKRSVQYSFYFIKFKRISNDN